VRPDPVAVLWLVLTYVAQVLEKIADFRQPMREIPAVFVVDRPKSACSEDLAS
jgi:hypothetical protein